MGKEQAMAVIGLGANLGEREENIRRALEAVAALPYTRVRRVAPFYETEPVGYLDQPHTSAGRVPSHKAYRLYVDRLLQVGNLSPEETKKIQEHLRERTSQVQEVIRSAAQVLSDATHYTSVIVAPQAQALRIRRVQLVPITENTALLVIVTNAGIVKDAVVRVPGELSAEHLHAISNLLTDQLSDRPIDQVRQRFRVLIHQLGEHRRLLANVMNAMETSIVEPSESDVVVGGSANLLSYPEYSDIEKARNFLAVLDSKETLARLLGSRGGVEFTIRIGSENEAPEFQDRDIPHRFRHERYAGHHRPNAHGLPARDRRDENAEIRDERAFVRGIKSPIFLRK